MTDADAKKILATWPDPLVENTHWRRLRPAEDKKPPYLFIPGSREFSIMPDGLYGRFVTDENNYLEFVDILAIEVCGKRQNFYDKRSRYAEQNPLGIFCQPEWLNATNFLSNVADKELQNIPVRYRTILYALPLPEFALVQKNVCPWGNEYFVAYDDLNGAGNKFGMLALPEARFIQTQVR
jgi:hypothetical protein